MLHDEIVALANLKTPQKKIAEQLRCSLTTVRREMKKAGLKGQSKGTRSFIPNSQVFSIIDTEDKAYWLGFMLADGCLAKSAGTNRAIRVSLQARDESHLKLLANFLGFKGEFFDDLRDNHPRKVMVFNDVIMARSLLGHGWINYKMGKSFEIIDIVPDNLFHHFLRGYFDGDGCISSQKRCCRRKRRWYVNIVCKFKNALEKINSRLAVLGPATVIKQRRSVWDMRWVNRANTTRICEYIYQQPHNVRLERKYVRWLEFQGKRPFSWNNIHDFHFTMPVNELRSRTDFNEIVTDFTMTVIAHGWTHNSKSDYQRDLENCKAINVDNYLVNEEIRNGIAYGNTLVKHFQPMVFYVRQRASSLGEISRYPKSVKRGVEAFLRTGDYLNPARLIRELRFAGFTMASLLSVPAIMAAIKYFGLSGKWFDPCAGWGNRLIAAKMLDLDYEATDPGVSYPGLLKIKEEINASAKLHNLSWQEVEWPDSDFVLTSPPFHNKEDYLDGVDYGKFDNWYQNFLRPLVVKAKGCSKRVILHVDKAMRVALEKDFSLNSIPLISIGRHKAPVEWFSECS